MSTKKGLSRSTSKSEKIEVSIKRALHVYFLTGYHALPANITAATFLEDGATAIPVAMYVNPKAEGHSSFVNPAPKDLRLFTTFLCDVFEQYTESLQQNQSSFYNAMCLVPGPHMAAIKNALDHNRTIEARFDVFQKASSRVSAAHAAPLMSRLIKVVADLF